MVYYTKISVLDDFPNKKNPSETWTHPPTSIVNSDFFEFFLICKAPKECYLFLINGLRNGCHLLPRYFIVFQLRADLQMACCYYCLANFSVRSRMCAATHFAPWIILPPSPSVSTCIILPCLILFRHDLFNFLYYSICPHTVFDLISGLFAYVIFGKKNALISEPLWTFFFGKYCQRALCNFLYLLYTLSASIPGAKLWGKEGNLYFDKYT